MIKEKEILVDMFAQNISYYRNKGYVCLYGEKTSIKVEDLNINSKIKITAICECGKESVIGYSKYITNKNRCGFYSCGGKCEFTIKKREILSMERYGVSNPSKLQIVKDKVVNTVYERYGKNFVSQVEEFKEKTIEINLEKRGVRYALSSKEVRDKGRETINKIYGVEHYSKSDDFKEKIKKVWENKSQEEIDEIYNRVKETTNKRYGVTSYAKTEKHRLAMSLLFKDDNTVKNRVKSRMEKIIKNWNILLENNFEILSYKDSYFNVKDLTTNDIFEISTDNLWYRYNYNLSLNTILFPIDTKQSIMEKMIINFLREDNGYEVIEGDRTLLGNGKEVDIYLPEYKFGIEIDGLYWHSELYKPNDYHINKTLLAKQNGIDLMHIYDSDWNRSEDIVKSYISNHLGKSVNILFEKCELKDIEYNEAEQFFNDNCLMKIVNSDDNKGLYIDGVLYGVYNVSGSDVRFCNKIGYNILNIESIKNYYGIELFMLYENRLLDYKNVKNYKSLEIREPNYFYIKEDIRFFDCGNIKINL